MNIKIPKENHVTFLHILYTCSKDPTFFADIMPPKVEISREIIEQVYRESPDKYFRIVHGRKLFVCLATDEVDLWSYSIEHGKDTVTTVMNTYCKQNLYNEDSSDSTAND